MLPSTWSVEGWRILTLLTPGEQVLALTPTSLEKSSRPGGGLLDHPRPAGKPAGPWRVVEAVGAIVTLPLRPFEALTDKLNDAFTNDPPVSGPDGSTAREVSRLADGIRSQQLYLAVTNQRLLVMSGKLLSQSEPFILLVAVPRAAVRSAEVRSRKRTGSVGRLHLTFADGSTLEFADGFAMGRGRATEIRDALMDDRVSVDGEPRQPRR